MLTSTNQQLYYKIVDEASEATQKHGEFASLHEAYGVLLEEVDEVWDIVRQKRQLRNREELEKEFIQIAAMAVKAIHSMDKFVGEYKPPIED